MIGKTIGCSGKWDRTWSRAGDIKGEFRPDRNRSALDEAIGRATNTPNRCTIVTRHSQSVIRGTEIMLALPDRGEAADNQLIIVDQAKISTEGQAKAVLIRASYPFR